MGKGLTIFRGDEAAQHGMVVALLRQSASKRDDGGKPCIIYLNYARTVRLLFCLLFRWMVKINRQAVCRKCTQWYSRGISRVFR